MSYLLATFRLVNLENREETDEEVSLKDRNLTNFVAVQGNLKLWDSFSENFASKQYSLIDEDHSLCLCRLPRLKIEAAVLLIGIKSGHAVGIKRGLCSPAESIS